MAIEVVWFKRDLRTYDNPPLVDASESGEQVACIFLIEPERLDQPDCDPIHIEWELDCAIELRRELENLGEAWTSEMRMPYPHCQKSIPRT